MLVVTGEALVDLVVTPEGAVAAHPGGGPYNVARTLARLGAPAAYVGRLSTDRFGRRLRSELEADGVRLDWAPDTDDPTTLALAELDPAGTARYRFYTEGTSVPGLTEAALPPGCRVLYAGTLGLVLEPLATTVERLVAQAPPDVLVAVDPNCRPSAIPDPAAFRARLARLLERAGVVKVSDEDLAWLAPGRPPVEAARALLAEGAVALVTLGADGAIVVTREEEVAIEPVAVRVADTIGAGDAFMGGLLARWTGPSLEAVVEAARFAVLIAARTCARPGADPPRASEL